VRFGRRVVAGVSVGILDYGGVDGVAYLDDEHSVPIWNETIYLLEALGWQVGACWNATIV
jgi:hypothetical protein